MSDPFDTPAPHPGDPAPPADPSADLSAACPPVPGRVTRGPFLG